MGRSADMVEALHMRRLIDRARQWTPQEELVDAAIAAIGVAADQIDVEGFEVSGRIALARDHEVLESLDVMGEQRLAAVGEAFADVFAPPPVGGRCDRARRVALDEAR